MIFAVSRGTLKAIVCVTAIALIYLTLADSRLRPAQRPMALEDFQAAEMDIVPPQTNDTKVLIVSAMFPLTKSKHSTKDYEDWLTRFLGEITTDIYMFTTPDLADTLRRSRGDLSITIDTTYSSPFEIPPLRGIEETYVRMNNMDKEKWHHSPGLYAVWNAKPYLLKTAVRNLRAKGEIYDYSFWNDAGSFRRHHRYHEWPNPGRVEQIFEEGSRLTGTQKQDLMFMPIFQLPDAKLKHWQEEMGPIANSVQFSEGSFFGGTQETIEWFSRIFYAYHSHYLSLGHFVGIDQDIFNSLFLLFPDRFFTVWMNDPTAPAHRGIMPSPSLVPSLEAGFLGECGPEWFYYQFWLADRPTRDIMRAIWIKEQRWRLSGWWEERKLCRMTHASSMLHILRTSFGEDWSSPYKKLIPV